MAFSKELYSRKASLITAMLWLIFCTADAQMNTEGNDDPDVLLSQDWGDSQREQSSSSGDMGQGELITYMHSPIAMPAKPVRQSTAENWFDSFRPQPSRTPLALNRKKIYSPEFNRVKQTLRPLDDISAESGEFGSWDVRPLSEYQPPRPYYERQPAVPPPSYDAPVNFDYLGNYPQYGQPEYPQYDNFASYPTYAVSNPYGSVDYDTWRRYAPMLYSAGLFAYP